MHRRKSAKYAIVLCTFFIMTVSANSRDLSYEEIVIDNVSTYGEDRIAYQQVEQIIDPELHQKQDTSEASLLIIRDRKMYLFKDGFDDPKIVEQNRIIKEMENRLVVNDMWGRAIDGKPDYVVITDRRTEIQKKFITPDKNDNLDTRYCDFYIKMRDSFIQKHVAIFRGLIVNRKDSDFKMERLPIPKHIREEGPTKYFTYVTAKTKSGEVYYAEDSDGDGVCETLSVELPDGFNWGYKSGPNILFILKNKQENIKGMIGTLTKEAYEGTPEEEKLINKQFDQLNKDIPALMDDIIRMDFETERLLKDSK